MYEKIHYKLVSRFNEWYNRVKIYVENAGQPVTVYKYMYEQDQPEIRNGREKKKTNFNK